MKCMSPQQHQRDQWCLGGSRLRKGTPGQAERTRGPMYSITESSGPQAGHIGSELRIPYLHLLSQHLSYPSMTSNNLLEAHECLPCTLFTGLEPSVHPPHHGGPNLFLITGRKEGKRQQVPGPPGFQELQDPPGEWQDQVWGMTRSWETTKGWTGPDSSECEDQEQVGGQKAGDKAPQKIGRE